MQWICVRGFWQYQSGFSRLPLSLAFFLTKKGKELLRRGRYVPVGRCPTPDRGGSRDRRWTRLGTEPCNGFASAVFGSDSPPAGLLLDKKGQRTFMSRALRPGGTLSSARPRRQPRPALDAPLPCGIQRICVRGFGRCRGFWLGLSYRWPVLAGKTKKARRAICFPSHTAWPHGEAASCQGICFPVY